MIKTKDSPLWLQISNKIIQSPSGARSLAKSALQVHYFSGNVVI